jgi:hypothetical protein
VGKPALSKRFLTILIVGLTAGNLLGCSEKPAPTIQFLTAQSFSVEKRHAATVSVEIKDIRQIDSPVKFDVHPFTDEVVNAIESSGVFSAVVASEKADYQLTVTIFRFQVPRGGTTVSANMEMGWILTKKNSTTAIWQEAIEGSGTREFSDSFLWHTRAVRAMTDAKHQAIKTGITKLSQLSLR